MRRAFQENLSQYNRIAKAEMQPPMTDTDQHEINTALQWFINDAAQQRSSTPEAQRHIYEVQQDKQQIMDLLHRAFRAVGTKEVNHFWPKGARKTTYENGTVLYNSQPIDIATLVTDAEWGVYYALPETTPKHLQKQYILALAKHHLSSMLNEQIITDETSSKRTDTLKRGAYDSLQQMEEEGSRYRKSGFIAETLVKNFLVKLSLRFDFDFEIIPSDVFDDVENKIDFVIRRKNRYRGVRVEEGTDIGIQFTINKDPDVRIRKERQLRSVRDRIRRQQAETPIEDIVLVQIDAGDPKRVYDDWKRKGSPPGGPDELWSSDLRHQIYTGMLQNIFPPESLEAHWSIIHQRIQGTDSRSRNERTNPFINNDPLTNRGPTSNEK